MVLKDEDISGIEINTLFITRKATIPVRFIFDKKLYSGNDLENREVTVSSNFSIIFSSDASRIRVPESGLLFKKISQFQGKAFDWKAIFFKIRNLK